MQDCENWVSFLQYYSGENTRVCNYFSKHSTIINDQRLKRQFRANIV